MREVQEQQITEHLQRVNGWWENSHVDPDILALHPRAYLAPVRRLLLEPDLRRAVVLLGPRRVGKTILIQHIIADLLERGVNAASIAYVEMDHPLLHGLPLGTLIRLIEDATPHVHGIRYLFFDEIQSLKDWEKHLKPLVDHRHDLRILVSGSAAAALKRQSTESGAGRFTDFLLPPLTFPEYLNMLPIPPVIREEGVGVYDIDDMDVLNAQFADYVSYGGYPELALSAAVRENPQRFVKSDIVDKVLLRDLPHLYGIQDIQELNSLFTLLAFNTGEEVSPDQLSQRSGASKPTIQKYIEYLEAAFLIKRLFRIDQDGKRYHRERSFKIYLTNPAMYTGLFGRRTPDAPEFGHLVETAIFSQRFHQDVRLNYARWGKEDHEVDLVEMSPDLKPIAALEIKWSDKAAKHPRILDSLMAFARKHHMPLTWATTRTALAEIWDDGHLIRLWPAALVAFHYGTRAVQGRLADIEVRLKGA